MKNHLNMTAEELFKKVDEKGELPTLPVVITKMLRLIRDPKTSAADIGKLLSTDISLSSKILKIVNSAFYGFPQRVGSVNQAVVILGFDAIKAAILGVSVISSFYEKLGSQKLNFDREKFWLHSLGTASSCRAIAKMINYPNLEETFIAGLLHDIGRLILDLFNHNIFVKIIENKKIKKQYLIDAELEILGFDHSELGALLIERWNFPNILIRAIQYHHKPNHLKGPEHLIASIVHLGDILSHSLAFGNSGEYNIPTLDPSSWRALGLEITELQDLFDLIIQEFANSQEFLKVIESEIE